MKGTLKYNAKGNNIIVEKTEYSDEELKELEKIKNLSSEDPIITMAKEISEASTVVQIKKAACDFLEKNNIKTKKGE